MKSIHEQLYGTYGKIKVEGIIQQLIPEEVMRHRNAIEFLHSEGYIRFKADSEASFKALYLSSALSQNERLYNVEATNNIYGNGKRIRGFVGIEVPAKHLF